MALSADQLAYVRSELGSEPSDSVLNTRFTALGKVSAVILEQLRTRRAELRDGTAAFGITGFYYERIDGNAMDWLNAAIARITANACAIDAGDYSEHGFAIARLVRPGWARRSRAISDTSRLA